MKLLGWILLTAWSAASIDPRDVGKINKAKEEARKAYVAGDFQTAAKVYSMLVDSMGVADDEVKLNLANAYFQLNDSTNALQNYQPLTLSNNKKVKTLANQQLGVLSNKQGKPEEALNYFKQSLKADPTNEDARFNYEMVKKKLDEKKKQEQQQQDKNKKQEQQQQQSDQEDKQEKEQNDQKNKEKKESKDKQKQDQEEKDKEKDPQQQEEEKQDEQKNEDQKDELPPSVKEKLKEMDMSEEKAKMILEAMKNKEAQYLQQNKRKPTKPKDKSKPDW